MITKNELLEFLEDVFDMLTKSIDERSTKAIDRYLQQQQEQKSDDDTKLTVDLYFKIINGEYTLPAGLKRPLA